MTAIPAPNPNATHDLSACARKVPYWAKAQAERVAFMRSQADGVPLHVYRCPFPEHYPGNVEHFHLTKMEQS